MRKYLPEIVGVSILLTFATIAFLLLHYADSAADIVLALLCLLVMKVDIWVYRRKYFGRSGAADEVAGSGLDLFHN